MSEKLKLPPDPGIYSNIPNSEYHADPNSLSSSGAKLLAMPGGLPSSKPASYPAGSL